MKFSGNNLLISGHFFFEDNASQNVRVLISYQIVFITVSRVITATKLFLLLILYSSSFAVTLKNEIPGTALEQCQLKINQFSPDILKFSTHHRDKPFTLNSYMVPRTFLFIFHAG